jgi:hypothetical protein
VWCALRIISVVFLFLLQIDNLPNYIVTFLFVVTKPKWFCLNLLRPCQEGCFSETILLDPQMMNMGQKTKTKTKKSDDEHGSDWKQKK